MDEPGADEARGQVLDGNALAGTLEAAFGRDMTVVPGRCANCGAVNVVAALRAYVRAPGSVLRCPACDAVVLRVVEVEDAVYVDARGATFLRFERH